MKIRIKGNSIRFRLTRSEVDALGSENSISETVDFGDRLLTYSVSCTESELLSVSFTDDKLTLWFPIMLLDEWKSTEKVGYKSESGKLSLLIEKDFTCLDNVEEDQSDNFPNPLLRDKI
ncbi:MAG: hypothetical protein EOO45_03685 [Flavobacterium sp.]|nr:MAG: hypothetical protein EOO45_03685 [Flavobacterium sp.]